MTGLFEDIESEVQKPELSPTMPIPEKVEVRDGMSPSDFFGLKVIGIATTPPIANLPPGRYEVIKVVDLLPPAGKSYMTNKWFYENNREPLWVTEQFGATFEPISSVPTMLIRRVR